METPATRSLSIYLPPSYLKDKERRFPVVYLLHGYTDSNEKWFGMQDHWINLPEILDSVFTSSDREAIVVMPNAHNRFMGSMYTNSPTTGNWEDFIAQELVEYVDSSFRTIAKKESRGLAGHSMGGYGTIKIGVSNSDVFGSLYLMSPCCLQNNLIDNPGLMKNLEEITQIDQIDNQPFFVSMSLAGLAAWSPNPNNPPLYFDLPFKDGEMIDSIVQRFHNHEIIPNLQRFEENLKQISHLALDVGDRDFMIRLGTTALHDRLDKMGIPHQFEIYEGDHVNKIASRLKTEVIPFFINNLKSE